MKISSVSKKVLASALSAAMVVAFAPTVAFAGDLGGNSSTSSSASVTQAPAGTVAVVTYTKDKVDYTEYFGPDTVADPTDNDAKSLNEALKYAGAFANSKVTLLADVAADAVIYGNITLDLNGHKLSNLSNIAETTYKTTDNAALTSDNATVTFSNTTANVVPAGKSAKAVGASNDGTTPGKYAGNYFLKGTNTDGGAYADVTAVDGKVYNLAAAGTKLPVGATLYILEDVAAVTAAAGTGLTVVDSSEGKTGVISGDAAAYTASGVDYAAYSATAIDTANATTVQIKGGTITSGSDTYTDNDITTIAGSVKTIENAVVKAAAGYGYKSINRAAAPNPYSPDVVAVEGMDANSIIKNAEVSAVASTAAKSTADATAVAEAINAVDLEGAKIVAAGADAAKGVVLADLVKKSSVEATSTKANGSAAAVVAAGATTDSTITATAGNGATATALETNEAVSGTTVTATAGDATKLETGISIASDALATAIKGTGTKTYKKVVATAKVGEKTDANKATARAIDASGATAITVLSGSYTGDLYTGAPAVTTKLLLQGGEYSDHAGTYADTANGYKGLCTKGKGMDYVYKTVAPSITVNGGAPITPTALSYTKVTSKAYDPNKTYYKAATAGDATSAMTPYAYVSIAQWETDVTGNWIFLKNSAVTVDEQVWGVYGLADAAETAATNALESIITGANTYGVGYTLGGMTAAEVKAAAIDAETSGGFAAAADVWYGDEAKKAGALATDEEKAAVEAFNKGLQATVDAAKAENKVSYGYMTVDLDLTYLAPKAVAGTKATQVASISDLGKRVKTAGAADVHTGDLSAAVLEDNTVTVMPTNFSNLVLGNATDGLMTLTKSTATLNSFDGNAFTGMEPVGDKVKAFKTVKLADAFTVLSTNGESATDKTEEPAATEKATQSIDVAKKSRTLTLKKGTTKTQKARYFKLGASAETELTIAKKSGSSRITVSGQKVTLKKGTKKGTFTAKVSLKAAGSDEFLAAAKTITVKFVVKK